MASSMAYYANFSLTLERKETKTTLLEEYLTDKMLENHFLKHKELHCCNETGQHGLF